MTRLSPAFWSRPFAHRGLHDVTDGRPENSLAAFDAALAGGYAIELDVQASADGEAMVFHDYEMMRLTGEDGRVDTRAASVLRATDLIGGGAIPDLETVLNRIAGRAPVLIEIKDQTGAFGPTGGALERRVCDLVSEGGHDTNCAVMSFNPYSALAVHDYAPAIMRGLVSYDFEHPHDAHVDAAHRRALADMAMIEECAADFVSYGAGSLTTPAIMAVRKRGIPVFTWTIKSEAAAQEAYTHCDQITFEGYRPDV